MFIIMNRLMNSITPLFVLSIFQLGCGLVVLLRDPGEEGWGRIAGIMVCLFALLLNVVLKRFFKKKMQLILPQMPVAFLIIYFYIQWRVLPGL